MKADRGKSHEFPPALGSRKDKPRWIQLLGLEEASSKRFAMAVKAVRQGQIACNREAESVRNPEVG